MPRHALAICEKSDLASRQDVTHSAAKVVVPNVIPLSIQRTCFACACTDRFSGVSKRANAFFLASSTASGFENCLSVKIFARSLASGLENCLIAASRNFCFTSSLLMITRWRSMWALRYSGLAKRSLALSLRFLRHSGVHLRSLCLRFVSSETITPDAPSPPSVLLQMPWSLYFKISSRSSSNAHHSCIPLSTISMV